MKRLHLFALAPIALLACSSAMSEPASPPDGDMSDASSSDTSRSDTTRPDTATEEDATDAGDAPSTGDADPSAYDAACTTWAASYCNKTNECSPTVLAYIWGDLATCKDRQKLWCIVSMSAPGSSYDPPAVDACAKANAALSCTDTTAAKVPPACDLAGKRAVGEPCGADSQCASKACGSVDIFTHCGTCVAQAGLGEACGTIRCTFGLWCSSGKCAPVGSLGAACSGSSSCVSSLTCFGGKCVAHAKAGEPCDDSRKTAPDCDFSLGQICDSSKTCVAYVLAKSGEPCNYDSSPSHPCTALDLCTPFPGPGTCVAWAATGAACDVTKGPPCAYPDACVSGICKRRDPASCK